MSTVRVYVSGRQTGAIPKIKYSTDLGASWNEVTLNAASSLINAIAVKQTDPDYLIFTNTYINGDGNNYGLQYSTDGVDSWDQSGGNWSSTVSTGSLIGYNRTLVIDPDPSNSNVFTTSTDFAGAVYLLQSIDDGANFNAITTSNAIYGSGNYLIHALAVYDNKVFAAVGAGTLANPIRVYKSTDYGNTFSLLGAAGSSYNIGSLYYDSTTDSVYAVALDGVYKSTSGGAFVSVYTFINSHFVIGTIKGIDYINGSFYFNDRTTVITADFTFSTVTNVYTTGAGNISNFNFYTSTSGFIIANGADVLYTSNNGVNINNTNTDVDFGPDLVATSSIIGCGCPPGSTLDSVTQQCITNTLACPPGYTYGLDPISNTYKCIGSTVPCETDIILVIDVGGSISGTSDFAADLPGNPDQEAIEYKAFLNKIIDAIELGYDAAGNLNTPANSAHRISSDQVRVGIATFSTTGNIVRNLLPGTIDGTGYYSGKVTQLHTDISNLFTDAAGGSGGTNTIGGLAAAYNLITSPSLGARVNNPIPPNRKMLLVTDGWPNTITSTNNFFGYDITANLPSTSANLSLCSSSGTAVNISENGFDFTNPITIPSLGNFTQTNFQVSQMWIYQRTMDFAQALKTGSSSIYTDIAYDCDINLVAIGDSAERTVTLQAFVGTPAPTYSSFTTPCLLNTKPYNDTVTVANGFLATTATSYNPVGLPSNANCPDIYKTYEQPSGGPYLKLPSNYATGLPIVFSSDWTAASLNSITKSVSNSLLCTDVIDPITCTGNCKIVTINNVVYCQCTSADSFVPCCYTLTNCDTGLAEYTVNTYGLSNDYLNALEGQVLKITGLDECLYVNITFDCTNSTEISIDAVEESFETCEECKQYIAVPPCYLLTNCNNTDITLLTNQNLSIFSGKVVELNDYPGLCWTVLKTTNCPGPFTTVGIVQSYDDCECCFQYQCK